MAPFLEVVRSPETSGPITGVALTSVRRMLAAYTLGSLRSPAWSAMSLCLSPSHAPGMQHHDAPVLRGPVPCFLCHAVSA